MKRYLDQQVPFTFPQVSGGSAGRGFRAGCAPAGDSALTRSSCSSPRVAEPCWALGRPPGSRACRRRRTRKSSSKT